MTLVFKWIGFLPKISEKINWKVIRDNDTLLLYIFNMIKLKCISAITMFENISSNTFSVHKKLPNMS